MTHRTVRLGPGDENLVIAAAELFDDDPTPEWTERFLNTPGHHLYIAYIDDAPAGFISAVEMTHPDKGTEMCLYELGTDEAFRRRGVARTLIAEVVDLARRLGCSGVYVGTEPDNAAAIATYLAAGFEPPETTVMMDLRLDGAL